MFIHGPYSLCPNCNKNQFGINKREGNLIQKKCKECLYESYGDSLGPFLLPELNKKIIYLDQFAISNFMKSINSRSKSYSKMPKDWRKLFEIIDILVKKQLIICPTSFFHENESIAAPDIFEDLKKMYNQLSLGTSFKFFTNIQNDQVYQAFEAWMTYEEFEYDLSKSNCVNTNVDKWVLGIFVTVDMQNALSRINEVINSNNRIHLEIKRVWTDWLNGHTADPNDYEKRQLANFKNSYIDTYLAWFKRSIQILKQPDNVADLLPPPEASLVSFLFTYLRERGVSEDELIKKVKDFFNSIISSSIPYLKIKAAFFKQLYCKVQSGQKRVPNIGMMNDINFVSVYLPYCDCMFVDNECRALLNENPLESQIDFYNTKIFSKNTIPEFIDYLNDIDESSSEEHKTAIRQLWGEEGVKPFVTLYEQNYEKIQTGNINQL
jgi:hypothetical protein